MFINKKIIIFMVIFSALLAINLSGCKNGTKVNSINSLSPKQIETPENGKMSMVGMIGNQKIHATLNIASDKVTGVYYFDKDKKNINLKSTYKKSSNNSYLMKDYYTVSLTEDTDKKREINGIFRSKDLFEGIQKDEKNVCPMYLIREDSKISPPKPLNEVSSSFDGDWTGEKSSYFVYSYITVKALFEDFAYYKLTAMNSAHGGSVESFLIITGNEANTTFDKLTREDSNKKQENVHFQFNIKNSMLCLKTNMYDFMCGMGAVYDSSYKKGKITFDLPTAKQVKIVDTDEQDKRFKDLVGDKYKSFVGLTQFIDYKETTLDDKNAKIGISYYRGFANQCCYMFCGDYIYVAINDANSIKYYTNDNNYSNKLPKPMLDEWLLKFKWKDKIDYNYKDISQ